MSPTGRAASKGGESTACSTGSDDGNDRARHPSVDRGDTPVTGRGLGLCQGRARPAGGCAAPGVGGPKPGDPRAGERPGQQRRRRDDRDDHGLSRAAARTVGPARGAPVRAERRGRRTGAIGRTGQRLGRPGAQETSGHVNGLSRRSGMVQSRTALPFGANGHLVAGQCSAGWLSAPRGRACGSGPVASRTPYRPMSASRRFR